MDSARTTPSPALLARWGNRLQAPVRLLEGGGLINETWVVGAPATWVLQRLHPIFPDAVNSRVAWVTEALEAAGVPTPRLLPTVDGAPSARDEGGATWRVLTFVPGQSFHRAPSADHARRAASLVARFHAALLPHLGDLEPLRPGVHDTSAHMARLVAALQECGEHRLASGIREVGEEILSAWDRHVARDPGAIPILRPAHGDLKISNVRFDVDGQEAVCLLDLDTLGRMPLSEELGDALRSWCNPCGEDEREPTLDLVTFDAALGGYLSSAPFVGPGERLSVVEGFARIPLELAARFCVDAFRESYFGWDPTRFPSRGDHNLLRARSQLGLARAVASHRSALEERVAGWRPGR